VQLCVKKNVCVKKKSKGEIKMNDNKKALIIRGVILVVAVLALIALYAWRFGVI